MYMFVGYMYTCVYIHTYIMAYTYVHTQIYRIHV